MRTYQTRWQFSFSDSTTVPCICDASMVSDNGSDLKYNNESNSIIENKDTNMAEYLEGEEKALIEIENVLGGGSPKKQQVQSQ